MTLKKNKKEYGIIDFICDILSFTIILMSLILIVDLIYIKHLEYNNLLTFKDIKEFIFGILYIIIIEPLRSNLSCWRNK